MAAISHRVRITNPRMGGMLVALLCLVAGTGCATGTYRARNLPPQFAASPISRLDKADLSRLASFSVRSDQVGAGDLLEVRVLSGYQDGDAQPALVRIDDAGIANVPLIGPVKLEGMTTDQAGRAIAAMAKERDVYRSPYVTVKMEEQATNHITISGAVNEPGGYDLPRGNSTLLAAIIAAGDLRDDASPDVTIRRPVLSGKVPNAIRNPLRLTGQPGDGVVLASFDEPASEEARTIPVDLISATADGNDVLYLDDGDAVHVRPRPLRTVHVTGLVSAPGEYDMPPNDDLYVLNALSLAGGHRSPVADSFVVLRRVRGQGEPIKITGSIREARDNGPSNFLLQENDVVMVVDTPVTVAYDVFKSFFRITIGSSLALF